jgi:ELWxxDGT repeat protein
MCNKLWFNASDSVHGQELWVSDGTTSGTQMVSDFCQGTCSSEIQEAAMSNGRFYFVAHDSLYNYKLYRVDECFTPFSVNELSNDLSREVLIYPNPSTGIITLTSPDDIQTIVVCDILGNEVKREKLLANTQKKELTLPQQPGIYFITIETKNEIVTLKAIRE